jgi:hypothetical protein
VNADTTWLLQLPIPVARTSPNSRKWFNILFDPWLTGAQSDIASWFSQQSHAIPPALSSISQVEDLIRQVEVFSASSDESKSLASPLIDVITISHEFTDHCHRETLLQCDRRIPVIATTKAAALIYGWKHFDRVIETPVFDGDWLGYEVKDFPDWVSITRLQTKSDAFYYHSAVMVAFDLGTGVEALIYTPHGIHAPSLGTVSSADPPISTLAFLHGLHDVSIDWGQQLNLGAHNGLAAQRLLGAKYWIGTHDEVKKGGGLVSWLLRRRVYTLEDALKEESKKAEEKGEGSREAKFLELKNGETIQLS